MEFILELATNFALISAASGWIVAQIFKFCTGIFKIKKFSVKEFLFGTGGMPSSHTAAASALACACAIQYGLGSVSFAISAVLMMIVMRDAMGMRRQVGEHAKALNLIFQELVEAKNDKNLTQKALDELAGHTPLQVFAGLLVGIVVPFLIALLPAFNLL